MMGFNHLPCERKHIEEFAAIISAQPLGLARYQPEAWGHPMRCFENAWRKVQQDGGRARFGWMFHYRVVPDIPGLGYLIAVHHAVWHAPEGYLVDVTPFHAESVHHPIAPGGNVLFLVDDGARPITRGNIIAPRPSRFHPLNTDERLIDHVRQLARAEEQECLQMYRDGRM